MQQAVVAPAPAPAPTEVFKVQTVEESYQRWAAINLSGHAFWLVIQTTQQRSSSAAPCPHLPSPLLLTCTLPSSPNTTLAPLACSKAARALPSLPRSSACGAPTALKNMAPGDEKLRHYKDCKDNTDKAFS